MLYDDLAPKGFLRDDHLLLVGADLASLSATDLKQLIAEVLESVDAMQARSIQKQTDLSTFLAKSLTETVRALNSPPPVSPYRRYCRITAN